MKVRRHRRKHARARKEADSNRGGYSLCLCWWVTTILFSSCWQHGWKHDWFQALQLICCALTRDFMWLNKEIGKVLSWSLHGDVWDCPTNITHMIYRLSLVASWIFLQDWKTLRTAVWLHTLELALSSVSKKTCTYKLAMIFLFSVVQLNIASHHCSLSCSNKPESFPTLNKNAAGTFF